MMVQRALSAKSLSHAQGGTLLAGFIKILPLFMIVMPGMIRSENYFIIYLEFFCYMINLNEKPSVVQRYSWLQ